MALDLKIMTKRGREEGADQNMKSMANCLMLLSNGGGTFYSAVDSSAARVFECKTCNRQFPSFQALGGHRASHKKLRLMGEQHSGELRTSPEKPKTHECPVCGMEFAIGQALGGHMRKHRTVAVNENHQPPTAEPALSLAPSYPPHPIVKRSNGRRVFCLDLNLTPLENKFLLFGKMVPTIDC
ncbi:zinc finger protein ZAT12-like [Olea europaea var. sylvestris]|uniref:Zinc finger ZAT11-like n=1 Tax=Olea europaea subsp. europaea TaxID=158383 RepID=A0A8S0VLE8_OLEEU|nr:zinc finger protein ZAT12-like [Olea europaea var. sylvestris]CAA3033204.1 zinc finger ZAT11-like [Olea europaea subsp. europaea]